MGQIAQNKMKKKLKEEERRLEGRREREETRQESDSSFTSREHQTTENSQNIRVLSKHQRASENP